MLAMMRAFPLAPALALLAACGPPPVKPPPDAGPDVSCGLDCAAQQRYGLVVGRCFEYSSTQAAANPASLGVKVLPVFTLEGGVDSLPFEYSEGGLVKLTDYFTLGQGALVLARRTFSPGQSVTYRDAANAIAGVAWLKASTGAGENFTTSTSADVVGSGARHADDTTYQVTTAAPTVSEQTMPAGSYPDAFKLLFSETPDHGRDPRRVFVPGTGFILFSTPFNIVGGTAAEYRLQKVRDIVASDAGSVECGFGSP